MPVPTISRIKKLLLRSVFALAAIAMAMPPVWGGEAKPRKKLTAKTEKTSAADDYDRQRRFNEFFLESVVQKEKGNYDASFELLRHALEIRPDAPEALSAMALMISAAGLPDTAGVVERMTRRAVEIEPDNYYFQEQLAEYYDSAGESDSAVARYEAMSRRFPDRDGLLYSLASIYSSQKNYKALVRTLGRIEVKDGKSDEITLRKIEAYSQAGEADSALVLVNALIDSDPENPTYRVIRGGAYGDMKEFDKEMAEYNSVLTKDPDNEMANWAVMSRYLAQNNVEAYLDKANFIATNSKMSTRFRLRALNSMIMSGSRGTVDSTAALPACRQIVADAGADDDLLDLCQAYMYALKMPDDTIAPIWKRLLAARPDYTQVRVRLLKYCVEKNKLAEVATLCSDGIQYEPDNLVFYFYGGLANYSLKQNEKAVELLKGGTERITDNTDTDLATDMFSLLGDVYHDLGKDSLCFDAYESALVYKDDNVGALNNYAYFLALKKQNLAKAEAMSLKTIKAEPNNATYLDTYAWVLFEQGRYDEAATFIDEALKNMGNEKNGASLYEHAGDIYSKQQKTAEALKMWRKAKACGGGSKTLGRKIKGKKYIPYEDENQ